MTNVSPICMPCFIHTFTIVPEKSAFFDKIPNFFTSYGPWWPLTCVKGNQYVHFWKAPITYYHCAKFQVSVFNCAWEKCNVNVLGPFFPLIIAPYGFWPLREVIKLSIFRKPTSHTTTVVSFKFLCSIVSEKNATLKYLSPPFFH